MLILLIRGEVLRRYPGASVFARRAAWGSSRVPRELGDEVREPQFRGALDPDLVFFGFPLTITEARGSETDPGWFFVLRQQPDRPALRHRHAARPAALRGNAGGLA